MIGLQVGYNQIEEMPQTKKCEKSVLTLDAGSTVPWHFLPKYSQETPDS